MLCVIAKLNEEARERLLSVQEPVVSFGLSKRPLYGHITLATFVEGDEAALIESVKANLYGEKAFSVQYEGIAELDETFIVVALLRKTQGLLNLQRKVTEGRDCLLDRWTHSAIWQPHTTLVHQPGMILCEVADAMQARFVPFEARINRVEFSRVTENGYEIVDGIDLTPIE